MPPPKIFQGPRGALKAAAGWGARARSTAQGSALLAGAGSAPCIARSTECTQGAWVQGALRQPGEGWGGPGKNGAPALCPSRSWGWRGDLRTKGGGWRRTQRPPSRQRRIRSTASAIDFLLWSSTRKMRCWGCGAAAVICRLRAVSWRGWELIWASLASLSGAGGGPKGGTGGGRVLGAVRHERAPQDSRRARDAPRRAAGARTRVGCPCKSTRPRGARLGGAGVGVVPRSRISGWAHACPRASAGHALHHRAHLGRMLRCWAQLCPHQCLCHDEGRGL